MSIFVPMRDQAVSVSELTYAIKGLLEEGIGDVLVSGEISNFKEHSSGHRYFTLKDADAQIGAVMWRTRSLVGVPSAGQVPDRLQRNASRGCWRSPPCL